VTCSSGKVAHSTREEALRFLHIRHPKSHRVGGLRPYRCAECRAWHLGNGQRFEGTRRFP
jgi:hypothetical protein